MPTKKDRSLLKLLILLIGLNFLVNHAARCQTKSPPHLVKKGTTQQLVVKGKPFLVLGGELGNSTASSMEYMRPMWPRVQSL